MYYIFRFTQNDTVYYISFIVISLSVSEIFLISTSVYFVNPSWSMNLGRSMTM